MDDSHWLPGVKMKTFTALSLVLLISACATTAQSPNTPTKEDVIRIGSMTTIDAIREAETYYQQSQKKDIDFLAPQHFSMAEQAIKDAKTLLTSNQPREQIVNKVAVAETVLRNGELMARKVKSTLKDELDIKESLDTLNAPKLYGGEYGSLVKRLNEVIRKVEEGKKNEVEKDRLALRKQLRELEARSIRHNALSEPEEILKRVKYRGGEKLAPMTYNDAIEVFKRAEEFIDKNPNMADAIQALGQEAMFAAKRALHITEQVAALAHKVNVSLEQVVLDEEYRIYRVSRALNHEDVRDNPIEMQSEIIARSAEEMAAQHEKQEGLIIALRDTLIKVRDSANMMAVNTTVKQLRKDKGELLAKEALYAAKVAQLKTDIQNRELALAGLQQQLKSSQETIALLQTPEQSSTADPMKALTQTATPAAEPEHKPVMQTQIEDVAPEMNNEPLITEARAEEIPPAAEEVAQRDISEQLTEVIEAAQEATAQTEQRTPALIESTSELITEVLEPIKEDLTPQTTAEANVEPAPLITSEPATAPSLDKEEDISFELEALASDQ